MNGERRSTMPDPLTLRALGAVTATEEIKFLYAQASELLKAWHERQRQLGSEEGPLRVPIADTDVLDGTPGEPMVEVSVLNREQVALIQLTDLFAPYVRGLADIDLNDQKLVREAGQLRSLLEAAYGQRFTFRGEGRQPTGSRVTVTQVMGEVAGSMVGAEADLGAGVELSVDQRADRVRKEGSIIGYKRRVGC
jgi:hypothetical protein